MGKNKYIVSLVWLFATMVTTVADPGPRVVYQWAYGQFSRISVATPSYDQSGVLTSIYLRNKHSFCGIVDSIFLFDLSGNVKVQLGFPDINTRIMHDIVEYRDVASDSLFLATASISLGGRNAILSTGMFATASDGTHRYNESADSFFINFGSYFGCGDEQAILNFDPNRHKHSRLQTTFQIVLYDDLPGISGMQREFACMYSHPLDVAQSERNRVMFFSDIHLESPPTETRRLELHCRNSYFNVNGGSSTSYLDSRFIILDSNGTDTLYSELFDQLIMESAFIVKSDIDSTVDELVLIGNGVAPSGIHSFEPFIARYAVTSLGLIELWHTQLSLSRTYLFRSENFIIGTLGNNQVQAINLSTGRLGERFTLPFSFDWAKFVEPYGTSTNRLDLVGVSSNVVTIYELADMTGINEKETPANSTPSSVALSQNAPNPFSPITTIRYSLKKQDFVRIEIYNLLGQRVRVLKNQVQATGDYELKWDGRDQDGTPLSGGVYFCLLRSTEGKQVKKMLLR